MIQLRDYQADMIGHFLHQTSLQKSVLGVIPTGGGKTAIAAGTAKIILMDNPEARILVLAHLRELLIQIKEEFEAFGLSVGYIDRSKDSDRPIQLGMRQSVVHRLDDYGHYDHIIIDEAHHTVCSAYKRIIQHFDKPVIGLTATPARLDGKGLGKLVGGVFDEMVCGPTIGDMTANGYLVNTRVYAPSKPDLSKVKIKKGDFDQDETRAIMMAKARIDEVIIAYKQYGESRKAVAFCIRNDHADMLASAFRQAGIAAQSISSKDKKADRARKFAGLADGSITVLCNCELISEGINIPDIGAVILARPTASRVYYMQQVGRGLRPLPGKSDLIILDHAGNTDRFGLIDEPVKWDINALSKEKLQDKAMTKTCPECETEIRITAQECPHCGHDFEREILEVPIAVTRTLDEYARPIRWNQKENGNWTSYVRQNVCTVFRKPSGYSYVYDGNFSKPFRDVETALQAANDYLQTNILKNNKNGIRA